MTQSFVLQNLSLSIQESYEPNPGAYKGRIKFRGVYGEIEIQLDTKLSAEVLKLCADSLSRATKELASTMTAAVFNSVPAIQDKTKTGPVVAPEQSDDIPF